MNHTVVTKSKRSWRSPPPVLKVVACITLLWLGAACGDKKPTKAPPIQARLELAAGEVKVDHGRGFLRAVSGTALLENAKISTGQGARALVRLPDGSSSFMRGSSELQLQGDGVLLAQGEYWLDAPPAERDALVHRIGDVSLTAVDSGLSVKRSADSVVVYVARGMATVSAPGGRVEVDAGEQATIKGKAAPAVEPVAFWDDWTGGMADFEGLSELGSGAGTIYGVDVGGTPGSPPRRLQVKSQKVKAVVREGLSETEVDQTFFNPGQRPVEGWYWFTIPERASVTSFAVETNGRLVEGVFTERKEASVKYGQAKSSGHAPAILEWIDARTYRARIFPVPASGTRRVVLRYFELRPPADGKLQYVYPMGGGKPVRIGEFSLVVDLGKEGPKMQISTLADARVEKDGKLVTMRRSGYTPRADFQLEAKLSKKDRPALTVARFATKGKGADYVMARFRPDLDWSKVAEPKGELVVVVDTSAGGDEASQQLKVATAEAVLRALSAQDRFALMSLDVKATVLHPAKGLAEAKDGQIADALERLAEHSTGGATDLASSFDAALSRVHGAEQPAVVYVGDGIATSGELTGEQLVERLRRALSTSRARLFTVAVGANADQALLGELARAGGGQSFRVDDGSETTQQALQLVAAIKVPTLTEFEIDLGAGLDEPFVSAAGKVSRGAEVMVLARTHHEIPNKVKVKYRLGGQLQQTSYPVERDKSVATAFVPRLWAAEYVRRLLGSAADPTQERGRIASLGIEYGLMTPFTSILALESEAAYRNMGIKRTHSPLRGVRLTALSDDQQRRLAAMLNAGPAPAVAFGCAKQAPEQEEEPAESYAKDQAQSGAQQPVVANGEENSVDSVPSDTKHRFGASGPAATAAPSPRHSKLDEKENFDDPLAIPTAPPPHARPTSLPPAKPAAGGYGLPGKGSDKAKLGDLTTARERARKEASEFGMLGLIDGQGQRNGRLAKPIVFATCSDLAKRPLAQRVIMWRKRLKAARTAADLIRRYESALRACELNDWKAERTFLKQMQKRIKTEGGATLVLRHFRSRPEVQKYLAKLILRRVVDPRIVAAVEKMLFGGAVNWNDVDLELQAIAELDKRIEKLREFVTRAPQDPNGDIRLIKLLAQAGKKDEALARGRRLRDRGFLTLNIARQLGDVLARSALSDEAVRTYSEIVEFDPHSIASRRLLGDIYLGHGWYAPAYRQYKTMSEAAPADSLGLLRLAAAAAGNGRVDEALRIERQVASAQGRPGPADPRRWARLMSAARLARLVAHPPKGTKTKAIKRKLKQLGLFRGPSTLVVLSWERLGNKLVLVPRANNEDVSLGEATDAAAVGLSALMLSPTDAATSGFMARLRTVPSDDPIKLWRHDIAFDGKEFKVSVNEHQLAAGKTEAAL